MPLVQICISRQSYQLTVTLNIICDNADSLNSAAPGLIHLKSTGVIQLERCLESHAGNVQPQLDETIVIECYAASLR